MSRNLTRASFENANRANASIGGSTNAVVHLLALAGRAGVKLALEDWDSLGHDLPCLVDLQPSGQYLMEDFCYAGGLPAVLRELGSVLNRDALTVNGRTLWDNVKDAQRYDLDGPGEQRRRVIRTLDDPFKTKAGIAVLRGNLAPDGAVIKPSAATAALMKHRGRAVVFEDSTDMHAKVEDESLDVSADDILVLKNCGPKGYPGMAEVGNMPIPAKLVKQGVTDMVRISDARMSGTAYGTVVLHAAPEAAAGGNLALVKSGDVIELDVERRRLHLDVSDEELARRRASWKPPAAPMARGYARLYFDHVQQADKGADLDFLVGGSGSAVAKDNH
jgi:dihydroxy-acid dehydratase